MTFHLSEERWVIPTGGARFIGRRRGGTCGDFFTFYLWLLPPSECDADGLECDCGGGDECCVGAGRLAPRPISGLEGLEP